MTKTGRTVPRQRWQFPPIDYLLVGAGAGLGFLWALLSIPVGLQWGVSPWSPLWEQALAYTICFPLVFGLTGGAALAGVGFVWDSLPLILLAGSTVGALVGLILSYRLDH